jgi:methyl-accepting chemotaxis protein
MIWKKLSWRKILQFGIRGRLYLLVAMFALACAGLAAALIWLQAERAFEARKLHLQQLVEVAHGVLAAHKALADSGKMPLEEARQRALDVIGQMRYGNADYFTGRNSSGISLLNPSNPDRVGQNRDSTVDSKGRAYSRQMTELVKSVGQGYVTYNTQRPDTRVDAEKTTFIKLYKPWDIAISSGVFMDDLAADTQTAVIQAALITFALVGVLGGLALWIARSITRPLTGLRTAMLDLAEGREISGKLDTVRHDEIGAMAKAVQVFKDNAVALKAVEAQAAAQQHAAEEEAKRNEQARAEAARQVALVIDALGAGLERLAEGDLTCRLNETFAAEYKKVQEDFNTAIDQLQQSIGAIVSSTREVSSAAAEISTSTTDLSQRTEEQAASLEETSASMEQISVTVKKNAESAQQANQLTKDTCDVADRGGQVVSQAVSAMSRIEESSRKIADIIGVIDEIARQTNLLALNAAVEAARAGEAGRGFAVVASEVRSLAQRSSQAAKDIKDLITSSSMQVQEGVDLVNRAGSSLNEIVESIKRVADIVADIANASHEQATGLDQINKALSHMDEVTQQNSALVEENAATAKTLEHQSSAMGQHVGVFRLDDAADIGHAPRPAAIEIKRPAAAAPKPPAAGKPLRRAGAANHHPVGRMQAALARAVETEAEFEEF